MKVTVKDKSSEIEYPCLMISDSGTIVLFREHENGVCLKQGNTFVKLGDYSNSWDMNVFNPFAGSVTLSNEE